MKYFVVICDFFCVELRRFLKAPGFLPPSISPEQLIDCTHSFCAFLLSYFTATIHVSPLSPCK